MSSSPSLSPSRAHRPHPDPLSPHSVNLDDSLEDHQAVTSPSSPTDTFSSPSNTPRSRRLKRAREEHSDEENYFEGSSADMPRAKRARLSLPPPLTMNVDSILDDSDEFDEEEDAQTGSVCTRRITPSLSTGDEDEDESEIVTEHVQEDNAEESLSLVAENTIESEDNSELDDEIDFWVTVKVIDSAATLRRARRKLRRAFPKNACVKAITL